MQAHALMIHARFAGIKILRGFTRDVPIKPFGISQLSRAILAGRYGIRIVHGFANLLRRSECSENVRPEPRVRVSPVPFAHGSN